MGEVVVKYLGKYLPHESEGKPSDPQRAAALIKAAMLAEACTSILAFLFYLLVAPLAAILFAKDTQLTFLFQIYGISILSGLIAESSAGVLQAMDRFRPQATINLAQSFLTAFIIFMAFLFKGSMVIVLLAYLLGKLILGIGPAILAIRVTNRVLGKDWWKASFSILPPWKELLPFTINTNLSATINLLVRDSEILWVAFFLSPLEAGYYKIALAVISNVATPVSPLINATFPEISRFFGCQGICPPQITPAPGNSAFRNLGGFLCGDTGRLWRLVDSTGLRGRVWPILFAGGNPPGRLWSRQPDFLEPATITQPGKF